MSAPKTFPNTPPTMNPRPKSDWENRHTPPDDDSDNESGFKEDWKDPQEIIDSRIENPFESLQKSTAAVGDEKTSCAFGNVNDEDEIGKLMGIDGEKLLAVVDDIRSIDALRQIDLPLPQLVVVGDTSSGKSSLLQALTRLPFPVSDTLCTRFVTETTIQRCGPSELPGYKIDVKMDGSDPSEGPPFQRKEYNGLEWADVYVHLQNDIADAYDQMNPWTDKLTPRRSFGRASHTKDRVGDLRAQKSSSAQLLNHRMVIDVRKPSQAHFSIVDVPGLVSNGARSDIQLSEGLTREYISNRRAIVLAVIQSDNSIHNQKVINLARDCGAIGRTIGVVTKCDRIEPSDEEKIFDLLRNLDDSSDFLKLGWFAVRNRNSAEVRHDISFKERDKKEIELFSQGKWKEATTSSSLLRKSIDPGVLGINFLRTALSRSLHKQVGDEFPLLRKDMKDLRKRTEIQLSRMGESRNTPQLQRIYLSEIQSKYEMEATKSLEGGYRPEEASKLRHHVDRFNKAFEIDMRENGVKYAWDSWVTGQTPTDAEGRPKPEGSQIFDWINKTWEASIGSEPKYSQPRDLTRTLFVEQTASWEVKADSYLENVEKAIHECNEDLFRVSCEDETLRAKIRNKLEAKESLAQMNGRSELASLLTDNVITITYHPNFDSDYAKVQRARFKVQDELVSGSSQTAQKTDPNVATSTWERFFSDNKRFFEVHDWLFSYWLVALPRFVDNVAIQVVERHLLGKNGPLRLFNRRWLDSLSDEELEYLAGEDEVTKNERRKLKAKLGGLNDALDKADMVLR